MTVLVHFYPNAGEKYPALKELDTLNVWKSLVFSSIACEFILTLSLPFLFLPSLP